tara:strand:- start:358 stop:744 length:387 start_codon:yes stop_codon:yes gene_type:complete
MKKLETFDEIARELKRRAGHIEMSVNNLMTILQYILEVVELTKAKGPQKKTFAISLLNQIIDEADISNEEKNECRNMIKNGTVSNTIDLVITASKKKTKINKNKKRLSLNFNKASILQNRFSNKRHSK